MMGTNVPVGNGVSIWNFCQYFYYTLRVILSLFKTARSVDNIAIITEYPLLSIFFASAMMIRQIRRNLYNHFNKLYPAKIT